MYLISKKLSIHVYNAQYLSFIQLSIYFFIYQLKICLMSCRLVDVYPQNVQGDINITTFVKYSINDRALGSRILKAGF